VAAAVAESEEQPEEVRHLTIVPVAMLDLPSMRALAYAASLRQPVLALHLSPTEGEAERFRCYWQTWGDQLPLEVIVSPHRAIVAPPGQLHLVTAPPASGPDADRDPPGDRGPALVAPVPPQLDRGPAPAGDRAAAEGRRNHRSVSPSRLETLAGLVG
jgi:hypothetical protein